MTHVDPATLLVDRNVRQDTQLDREFLASVSDLGVLVPIVAVRTADGSLRVRYGHRRALAATEAGHAYVPVVVVADEANDDAAEVERLVGQYAENEHRTALTVNERVQVFTQLSAFGISAAQIAKRTKTRRTDVADALAVGRSDVAQAVSTRYDFMTLSQAATVAEFGDDREAVKALVTAARDGGFDHLCQRLRDERTEAAEIAKVTDALQAAGVTVVDPPTWTDPVSLVESLADADGQALTVEGHASCPGHGAYVSSEWANLGDDTDHDDGIEYVAAYVCTDAATYGHQSRWKAQASRPKVKPTDEQREAASVERRRVVANNKAWRSAETVRRDWLRSFVARRTAPKGAGLWVADSLIRADYDLTKALDRAHLNTAELFGVQSVAALTKGASDGRAQMVSLALVLAAYELGTGTHSWRNHTTTTARYLAFLSDHGYQLSDVERLACDDEPSRQGNDESGEDLA